MSPEPSSTSNKLFDPEMNLPSRLQKRLDAWHTSPPKHQFQAYGPLNAYLQGHKFPTDRLSVKPQKLLREEFAQSLGTHQTTEVKVSVDSDDESNQGTKKTSKSLSIFMEMDEGSEEGDVGNTSGDSMCISIDFSGVGVNPKGRLYPDFEIDQYFGADTDENPKGDIARVVIEIGSEGAVFEKVFEQLVNYMDALGPERIDGRLLGIAMIGNQVTLAVVDREEYGTDEVQQLWDREWFSIFDGRLVEELNKTLELSLKNDPNPE